MEISFYPVTTKGNKYSEIITSQLKVNGVKVYALDTLFSNFSVFRRVRIVHLNWFENLDGNSNFSVFSTFLKKMIKIIIFKIFRKKIVWTMHNKIPHDKSMLVLKRIMVHCLISFSDSIVIHSKVSEQIVLKLNRNAKSKIRYIPHPDYIGCYGNVSRSSNALIKNEPLKLLFLGAVKPYKNLELLLDVILPLGDKVLLTIAGTPQNSKYKESLVRYSQGSSNVILDLKFIPDDKISDYISNSDLLVMPYDIRSSLNSGTVILAFSYAKTVICPTIGTILDIEDQHCVLSYTYDFDHQHFEALSLAINRAVELKQTTSNAFVDYGNEMLSYVTLKNNKNQVVKELVHLYKQLV